MQNPRSVSDLLSRTGNKLTDLKKRLEARTLVLEVVRAALPPRLALAVQTAGLEQGRLTVGVSGAHWASRIRYFSEAVRKQVANSTGLPVVGVRIRVLRGAAQ